MCFTGHRVLPEKQTALYVCGRYYKNRVGKSQNSSGLGEKTFNAVGRMAHQRSTRTMETSRVSIQRRTFILYRIKQT